MGAAEIKKEEYYRLLFDKNPLPVWVFDKKTLFFVSVNEAAVKNYGYSEKEFLGMTLKDIHPKEEIEKFVKYYNEANHHHFLTPHGTWKHMKKDGTIVSVQITASPLSFNGAEATAVVVNDITNQERAQQALAESEERFRLLSDSSLEGIVFSENQVIVDANEQFVKMFGYKNRNEILGKKIDEMVHPDSQAVVEKNINKPNPAPYEVVCYKKDGTPIVVKSKGRIIPYHGRAIRISVLSDITQQKENEKNLKESEENYKSLIEHTPDGILIHDEKGEVVYANPAAMNLMGLSSIEKARNKNLFSYVLPEYHQKIKRRKAEMNKKLQPSFLEVKIQREDGKVIEVETRTSRIVYKGSPSVEVVLHDVALQRQLEREHMRYQLEEKTNRELKREMAAHIRTHQRMNSNQKYIRLLIDSSLDMIFACDQEGKITEFNYAAQQAFGYSTVEILGKHISILYADKKFSEKMGDLIFEDGNFKGDASHLKKNGEIFPAHINASILKNDTGERIGTMSISRDITLMQKAEEHLRKSVHEKETLLKEIHHRVKNNLQIITSILKLQSTQAKDKKTIELLNECRNRIVSMAFIHATLYLKKDFANINFAEYVGSIAGNLQQSYISADKKILLSINIPKVHLHIDDATPCGLIINELLSNSFKYAFAKKKKGVVGMSAKIKKENIILAIWDDGSGMPKSIDYKKTESLGLQLVISLVEQIEGKIKMESKKDKGTKYIIAFRKSR